MRFSTILTNIREALSARQYSGTVKYRAALTSTAVTELPIDSQPSRRLVPALDSGTLLRVTAVLYRPTGAAVFHSTRRLLAVCSPAGVVTLTDLGDTGLAVAGPSGAFAASAPTLNGTAVAATNGLQFVVVPAVLVNGAVTVPAFLRLDVSSASAALTYLEVDVEFSEAGPRG